MARTMQFWPLRVPSLIDHAEREHGAREIVSALADGSIRRSDWRTLAADARRLAAALVRGGVRPGERVASLAMNHYQHLVAWYGVIGAGAVLHTLNPRLSAEQLTYIVNHAEDRLLLHDHGFAPLVADLKAGFPTVREYVAFNSPDRAFDQWLAASDGDFEWAAGDERDPCALCYTSGTTGKPKGVLYEHRTALLHAMAQVAPDVFDLSARSVMLPIVPMFHANAWGVPFATALVGAKLVLSADYRPAQLCDLFRDEEVTHSAGVPTVWLGMIDHVERHGGKLGPLKWVAIGGSAAPAAMIRWFRERDVTVGHLWGMTEISPLGTVGAPPAGWEKMGDDEQMAFLSRQGRVPYGVELRTVDEEGRVLPRDGQGTGRLQVRGHWSIRRYFRHDEDSADDDGWFDTGDVGKLHPDGTLQLTDRAKDVVKSGGEWISSIDIENCAVGCPGVAEAAVIAIPHPKWDERPLLLVVPSAGSGLTADEVRSYLEPRMPRWWLPDAIELVGELPHTATGKLLKSELRERYRDYRLADVGTMVGRD